MAPRVSLENRSPMTREQWRAFSLEHGDEDPRIVEFLSLQDLKGSQYFGGFHDKLRHIGQLDWDLLVIDEGTTSTRAMLFAVSQPAPEWLW